MSHEVLPGSQQSWRPSGPADPHPHLQPDPPLAAVGRPDLPDALFASHAGPWRGRLAALWQRYRMRATRADLVAGHAQRPDAGLPVAPMAHVWGFVGALLRKRVGEAMTLVLATAGAAISGAYVPKILGALIDAAGDGRIGQTLTSSITLALALVVLQSLLNFVGGTVAQRFGQSVLAEAREQVVASVLRLPLSRVESASTGDLVTRVTRDVGVVSEAAAWALPVMLMAGSTIVFTLVAILVNSLFLAIPNLVLLVVFLVGTRWYLQRSLNGYIAESAAYSDLNTPLTETVQSSRTVEALGLETVRSRRTDGDLEFAGQAERYTMTLRNLLFTVSDFALKGPLVFVVLMGWLGYHNHLVTIGQVATAALYAQMLIGPMDRLTQVVDRFQMAGASIARLLGIAEVEDDRQTSPHRPDGEHLLVSDVRFAYREGTDVLHGINLDLRPGERLAIVGPSGSGKSTLGRLLAGINAPTHGRVSVGGVDVTGLPLDELRTQVALVTQEHHVFVGSVRDNIILARETSATDDQVWTALQVVGADDWVRTLPQGLDTLVGAGNLNLTPAQAQQVALARLVIADPHTLVLDEATSLIDPRTARRLESAMSNLLEGRTVVAIAHRLHTAHDADRIAVMIDGRIAELGSHDELMARDGEYAALWHAWTR